MNKETTTQKDSQEQYTHKPMNRRQRRYMMKQNGMLKHLSKLSPFHPSKIEIREHNRENGRKIQNDILDELEKKRTERLESNLKDAKVEWYKAGYNENEIDILEQAWTLRKIKNKETYQQDKKEAKKLVKEAKASLLSRNKG